MVSLDCCGCCPSRSNDDDHDPRYLPSGGIESKRGCTDILCLILFVLFWIGMVIIAGFGFAMGDPTRLVYPSDYEGNLCGYPNDGEGRNLTERPYLFYPIDFTQGLDPGEIYDAKDMGICVMACPNVTIAEALVDSDSFNFTKAVEGIICDYSRDNLTQTWEGLEYWLEGGDGCFLSFVPTVDITFRCLPNLPAIQASGVLDINEATAETLNATVFAGEVLVDGAYEVYHAWAVILISVALCLLLCFVYLFLMRVFVGVITWITVILVQVALAAGGAYFTYTGYWWMEDAETDTEDKIGKTALGFGIALCILAVLYFLLLLWLLRRIRFAIAVIKEASKALMKMPSLLFFPSVTFLLVAALSVWYITVASFLASASQDVTLETDDFSDKLTGQFNQSLTVSRYDSTLRWFELYHVFGYFWGNAFIVAIGYTTTAGAVAAYFFSSPSRKYVPRFAVLRSFWRVVRYHLGSLAFGSLLVAIVQFIRYLVKRVTKKLNKAQSTTVKVLQRIVRAILWVLEKIVKFINKNAYIVMTIQGKGFCASAQRAFMLILENIVRVSAVNMISSFILFLGKVMITLVVAIISYLLMDPRVGAGDALAPDVEYAVLPALLIAVVSFVICTIFMDVYDTVIDTMLMCVCFDQSNNDGNAKPYYMPRGIQRVVNVRNETSDDGDEKKG
eukprot:gb/GECH01011713.1/.p1 GENE.gb/GECH01011713.1/~~gb/GECH01011713.1/.p1  ORF type:complete len:675 (+),score=74.61 gb/GECH01011713.1/:1-2025(+)